MKPVDGTTKELTQNLSLKKNTTVSVLVKWGMINDDPMLRLNIQNNETLDNNTTVTLNGKKRFSHIELPLSAGEYQLTITNFSDGTIEHISVKANEGKETHFLLNNMRCVCLN